MSSNETNDVDWDQLQKLSNQRRRKQDQDKKKKIDAKVCSIFSSFFLFIVLIPWQKFNAVAPKQDISDVYEPELKNNWLLIGFSEMQGRRPQMEDAHFINAHVEQYFTPNTNENNCLIGIFDGHGGSASAEFVAKKINETVANHLQEYSNYVLGKTEKISAEHLVGELSNLLHISTSKEEQSTRVSNQLKNEDKSSDADEREKKRLGSISRKEPSLEYLDLESLTTAEVLPLLFRDSFLSIHSAIKEQEVPHGTCATVVYLDSSLKKGFVANVGDSRAVLCRNGKAIRLTIDHRANDEEEQYRVQDSGGFIFNGRLNSILAVTRALGDSFLEPSITADPHTEVFDFDEHDEFLILACDGLWDVCDDETACNLVREEFDPRKASVKLRDYAFDKGSMDNISVLVVRFLHPQ